MKVRLIVSGLDIINDISFFGDTEIDGFMQDANLEKKNSIYFCYKGKTDGFELVCNAAKNGATVIVSEKKIDTNVNLIIVKDIRMAMSIMAQNFYETRDVRVIGITGTNGKTTTTFIIKEILEKAKKRVGVIGTNGIFFCGEFIPAKLTTPDPVNLHEIFALMKKAKVDFIVMEVSAHAISLEKIVGINFICKILTNITQDHLDYFKTMEQYKKTKLSFFAGNDLMVVNSDDESGREVLAKNDNAISYGITSPSDVFALEINQDSTNYIINLSDNVFEIHSKLYGRFNVYNSLAAASACYFLGIPIGAIKEGLESIEPVNGRFNMYKYKNSKIIIDFAHTPDGLENVLVTARGLTQQKLICLFGCGGDRDKTKRPIMGAVAEKFSDFAIITSDNPRNEEPLDIINQIAVGFNKKNYYLIEDRKMAIMMAIRILKDGDTLIICGKGGENYIEIKGKKLPYSDAQEVEDNIKCL